MPKPERRALNTIAQGGRPHDAFTAAYGPERVASTQAHAVSLWTGPMSRHAIANALQIRLAEPNEPDCTGAKYLVMDGLGNAVCTPCALLEAVRMLRERRAYEDVVMVVGSDRTVVEWTLRGDAQGRAMRPHPPGISIAEQDALEGQATAFGHSWVNPGEEMVILRVRVRESLLRRIRAAAEYDRQVLREQVPRGKYFAAWIRDLLLNSCARSEMERAGVRMSDTSGSAILR